MSLSRNLPDVSGCDVLICPLSLGLSDDLLQMSVGRPLSLVCPEAFLHGSGGGLTFLIPPTRIKTWRRTDGLHCRFASFIECRVYGIHRSVDPIRIVEGGKGGEMKSE
jgi:hypothetical protein